MHKVISANTYQKKMGINILIPDTADFRHVKLSGIKRGITQ